LLACTNANDPGWSAKNKANTGDGRWLD